jgi:hypothetical protein
MVINRPSNIPDVIVTSNGLEIDIQRSIHSIHKDAFIITEKFAKQQGLNSGFFSVIERIPTMLFLKHRKNCKWIENLTYYAMTYGEYVDRGDDIDTSERLEHVRDKIRQTLLEFICYNKPSLCIRGNSTASTLSTSASTPSPRTVARGKSRGRGKTHRVKKSSKNKSYRKVIEKMERNK